MPLDPVQTVRRYLDEGIPLVHPVQLLDASIRGLDLYQQETA